MAPSNLLPIQRKVQSLIALTIPPSARHQSRGKPPPPLLLLPPEPSCTDPQQVSFPVQRFSRKHACQASITKTSCDALSPSASGRYAAPAAGGGGESLGRTCSEEEILYVEDVEAHNWADVALVSVGDQRVTFVSMEYGHRDPSLSASSLAPLYSLVRYAYGMVYATYLLLSV